MKLVRSQKLRGRFQSREDLKFVGRCTEIERVMDRVRKLNIQCETFLLMLMIRVLS